MNMPCICDSVRGPWSDPASLLPIENNSTGLTGFLRINRNFFDFQGDARNSPLL
jgi:hypothetical protein